MCGTSKVTEAAFFFPLKFHFSNITCNKKVQSSWKFSEGLFAVGETLETKTGLLRSYDIRH